MASINHNKILEDKLQNKETFSDEEKRQILERLNEERRINQKAFKGLDGKNANYNAEEKYNILSKLNAQRLSVQKREEIKKSRLFNKEVYHFGGKSFYKFLNMEREYFIEISDCEVFSRRPAILPLYYRTFGELKHKDVLIKTEVYSNKIFISYDVLRVYFKAYSLEDTH